MAKVTFRRDGTVLVDGVEVGTFSTPSQSGAAWANARRWGFTSFDGRTTLRPLRTRLVDDAIAAAVRLSHIAAPLPERDTVGDMSDTDFAEFVSSGRLPCDRHWNK